MALEDALVLADLLAHQRVWSEVGRAFQQHRRSRIKHVRAATDQMFRLLRPPICYEIARRPCWARGHTRSAYAPLLGHPLSDIGGQPSMPVTQEPPEMRATGACHSLITDPDLQSLGAQSPRRSVKRGAGRMPWGRWWRPRSGPAARGPRQVPGR
jgi:hypothetical protein